MKKKIHLTLLIVIISTLIISIGCGGGNDGIVPSSIPNSTDNNNTLKSGYIKVTVVWPQNGIEGKCLFTSGDGTITASMPADTQVILVTVRSDPDNPDNIFKEYKTQWKLFERPNTTEPQTCFLQPIPAVKVIVRTEAFNLVNSINYPDPNSSEPNAPPNIGGDMVSVDEEETDVLLGEDNDAELDLGNYSLSLYPNPSPLVVIPNFESDFYSLIDETNVRVQLKVKDVDDYNTANQKIDFKIISNNAYFPDEETEITVYTEDKDGNCYFDLKAKTDVQEINDIKIHATVYAKYNENLIILEQDMIIPVADNLAWDEDFESWTTGYDYLNSLGGYSVFESNDDIGRSNNGVTEITGPENTITKALKLYSRPKFNDYPACGVYGAKFGYLPPYPETNMELRLYIQNGGEELGYPTSEPCIHPKFENRTRGHINFCGYFGIINFKDKGNSILAFDETTTLGNYNTNKWHFVKIQIVSDGNEDKITYWIDGNKIEPMPPGNKPDWYDTDGRGVGHFWVQTFGGTVYYDDIKVYNLNINGLPRK